MKNVKKAFTIKHPCLTPQFTAQSWLFHLGIMAGWLPRPLHWLLLKIVSYYKSLAQDVIKIQNWSIASTFLLNMHHAYTIIKLKIINWAMVRQQSLMYWLRILSFLLPYIKSRLYFPLQPLPAVPSLTPPLSSRSTIFYLPPENTRPPRNIHQILQSKLQ